MARVACLITELPSCAFGLGGFSPWGQCSKTLMGRDAFLLCTGRVVKGEVWKEVVTLWHLLCSLLWRRLPLEVEELDGNAFLYQVHAYIPTKVFVPHFEDLWAKPQPLVDSSLTVPCLTLRLWKTVMVTGVALNLRLLTSQGSFRLPAVILRSLVTFLLCAWWSHWRTLPPGVIKGLKCSFDEAFAGYPV